MRSRSLGSLLGVALLSFSGMIGLGAPASAHPWSPPSDEIVIDVATVNGSGCPQGTAAVAVAPDNTAFTVTYSDYLAQVGPNSTATDFRKNCQLNLLVHVPHGFTYAIAKADYRGFAHLESGARAEQRANYYFQGDSPTATTKKDFNGPLDESWQTTHKVETGQLVYAPCGEQRYFNINTELRVYSDDSTPEETSFITMDSTDGSIDTTYHFAWKKCDA